MSDLKLKHYKPTTPSLRGVVLVDKSGLWKGDPFGPLTKGIRKTGGRNNSGKITSYHKGGGIKRRYRLVDFKRNEIENAKGVVKRIEYDPNRTGYIALLEHDNNKHSYILAPQTLKIGDVVESSITKIHEANKMAPDAERAIGIRPGNTLQLKFIPIGSSIYNVETKPGQGGRLARSAGVCAQLIKKEVTTAVIKMPSGEYVRLSMLCAATIGVVSNEAQKNIKLGKAGRSRWLGIRPTVRGTAMNTVDHPHGGGRGKSKGGRHPVTPWGILTKGKKTVKRKKFNTL